MGNKSKEDSPRFKIFRKFKGYGYIDKSGKEVIPCKYDEYDWNGDGYFHEGLAEVRLDDSHWAWIDKKGKEVVVFDH